MRAMGVQLEDQGKIIQERIAEEDLVQERVDEEGKKWRKIYFGGGEHCRHWLESACCRRRTPRYEEGQELLEAKGIPMI